MNVTREEAAEALQTIGRAGEKIGQLKGYHHAAPHLIAWGLVWVVANTVTDLAPQYANLAWMTTIPLAVICNFVFGYLTTRAVKRAGSTETQARFSGRFVLLGLVFFVFFVSLFTIMKPENDKDVSAVISMFFPFVYMGAGLWLGWRLFAIGAVTVALIMGGYLWLPEHFFLWMGLAGGGALIAGGLWLRSA